jgi:hypothetical protein
VRPIPSFARALGDSCVISSPWNSVAGDDVEERRLACAVRAEDGAPLAVRDVQVDVAHGVKAPEPPADPPQAEDRLGVLGCCCLGHRTISR